MYDHVPKTDPSRAKWRPMSEADVAAVVSIAGRVHVDYPEDDAVFAERRRLYPDGCMVLDLAHQVSAYVISHPWHYLEPPSLNALLGELPKTATTYYIHDLALLPDARGVGAASSMVERLLAHACSAGFPNSSLVAVKESPGFWRRHGFEILSDPVLDRKLRSYDEAARYMVRTLS